MQPSRQPRRLYKERKRGITQRKSCDTCHRSKTKCDRRRPICSTCTIFNRRCTYKHRDEHGAPSVEPLELDASKSAPDLTNNNGFHSDDKHISGADLELSTQDIHVQEELPQTRDVVSASVFPMDDLMLGDQTGSREPSISSRALMPLSRAAPACGCSSVSDRTQGISGVDMSDGDRATSTQRLSTNDLARALLDAMANSSDQDSSTILAAIRIGTPWKTIHNALVSDIYAENGLAYALEVSKAALLTSDQTRRSTLSEVEESAHYHPNRTIFDHLQYASRSLTEVQAPKDIVGTLRHEKTLSRRKGKPPLLRERTKSGDGKSASSDLRLPIWSVLPLRQADDTDDPFGSAFAMMKAELASGLDLREYCGEHAYLSVLVNPKSDEPVPRLSRVVGDLVSSIMPHETSPSATTLAIFWLHWCLWAWLLAPTPDSFERLPQLMRPTPWQICAPHTFMYNFPVSAALRDHLCRSPLEKNSWVTEAASTVQFTWPKTTLHALCRDSVTKALDLSLECKRLASQAESWTLGPSVRAHFPNIDTLITIRPPQQGL